MKRVTGEFAGLDFYFADRNSADGFRDVVHYCLAHGAKFSGEAVLVETVNARLSRMNSIYSFPSQLTQMSEVELMEKLEVDSARVTTVGLWNAIGVTQSLPEIVTFNGVSEAAPPDQANPIAILTEGWRFSTPGYESDRILLGRKCYGRFKDICIKLRPAYAAILNEDSLLCPHDMLSGRGGRGFHDFFLSEQTFGWNFISKIETMFQDAFVERVDGGLYVATRWYSPKAASLAWKEVAERSSKVALMVASRLGGAWPKK